MEGDSKNDKSTGHIFPIRITIIADISIGSTAYKFETTKCPEY
jgi:hypothetical protein